MRTAFILFLLSGAFAEDYAQLLAEGRRRLEENRPAESLRWFERAIELEPGEPSGHYYLGVALLAHGRNEEAALSLERARSLSARPNPSVLFELGTAYLRMDRLEAARALLERAVALAPDAARMHLQLGWVYYRQVEGERSREAFRKAVSLDPGPLSYYYLALAELALGNVEAAVASCRAALEGDPGLTDARVVLGKSLAQLGRSEEAREQLAEALRLDPGSAEAHYQLGLLSLRGEELNEAAERFESAVRAEPDHRAAWYNLAVLYARLGRKEKAAQARLRHEELARTEARRGESLSTSTPRRP